MLEYIFGLFHIKYDFDLNTHNFIDYNFDKVEKSFSMLVADTDFDFGIEVDFDNETGLDIEAYRSSCSLQIELLD
jgi:hypothetical protein